MSDRKRLTQLGNIRALCIFLVVLGHSIILYSSAGIFTAQRYLSRFWIF